MWVWGSSGPAAAAEAASAPWRGVAPKVGTEGNKAFLGFRWYFREIPAGYVANRENSFNDPSHDTVLHHKANFAFDRKRSSSFPKSVVSEITMDGYSTAHTFQTKRGLLSFTDTIVPPTGTHRTSTTGPSPFEGVAYTTPAARGKIYSFLSFIRGSAWSPLSVLFSIRWISHLMTHALVDADNIIQHSVDHNRAKGKGNQVYLPSDSDRGVAALWTWLDRFAGGGPSVSTLSSPIDPTVNVPRRVMLDRYHQHTLHCKSCLGAMKSFERVQAIFALIASGLFIASVSSLTLKISSVGIKAISSTGPVALAALSLVAALVSIFCSKIVQRFVFIDYDKNHVSKK